MRFSTDGDLILLSTAESSVVMVLDAFKGDRVAGGVVGLVGVDCGLWR